MRSIVLGLKAILCVMHDPLLPNNDQCGLRGSVCLAGGALPYQPRRRLKCFRICNGASEMSRPKKYKDNAGERKNVDRNRG
jgi:hypothetical protein